MKLSLLLAVAVACNTQHLDIDGHRRSFIVHTPSEYDGSQAVPMLLALHGRYGTARSMARTSGFDDLIDSENFIAVYPDGYKRSWADGRNSGPAAEANIDDVSFINAIIDHMIKTENINEDKIFIVGISNGGIMTQRLCCEIGDRFAGAASIISSMSENVYNDCHPQKAISMLLMNGTDDPLVPYEGGYVQEGLVVSTEENIAFWVNNNECEGEPVITEQDNVDDGTSVYHEFWGECNSESSVALYKIIGGGHTWPGGPQYMNESTVGIASEEFVAAEKIWEFFKK